MRRVITALGVWFAAAAVGSGDAHSQARGPSHNEIGEQGRHIVSTREARELARQQGMQQAQQQQTAMLDPAARAGKFTELDVFLRRLPGRFRIDGHIESNVIVVQAGAAGSVLRRGQVTGIADCSAVGEGVGLNCVMTANWPILESPVPIRMAIPPPPPPTEQLNTVRPALLVLGLNMDTPGIRALFVSADTLSSHFAGTLDGDRATAVRPSLCKELLRCWSGLEVTATPDSDIVTMVLRSFRATVTLTMHRDPQATLEKALKPMKAR